MITIKFMSDKVTDEAIMEQHNLTWLQLYALKHNHIGGYFMLDGLKYSVTTDKKKAKPFPPDVENPIHLPPAFRNGKKVNFLITDVKYGNNVPPKNTFRTFMTIYDEKLPVSNFVNRTGISYYTLKNKIGSAESFVINGVPVFVDRVVKEKLK